MNNIIHIAEKIREKSGLCLWIRTPIIPGFTDSDEVITEIAEFINKNLRRCVQRWELCAFNNSCIYKYEKLGKTWELRNSKILFEDKMLHLCSVAKKYVDCEVIYSGITQKQYFH